MKNEVSDAMSKISGIYKITNTVTNEVYIGKSKDIEGRIEAHKNDLKNGNHVNKGLQEDYDLTEAIFPEFQIYKYEIIRNVKENELSDEEMRLIEEKNSFKKGYNRTKGGKYDKYKGLDEWGGDRLLTPPKRHLLIERELIKYLNSIDIDSMNETEKEEFINKLLKKIATMNKYYFLGSAYNFYFEKILEINPDNKDIWYYKAETLLKTCDYNEALESINKSIEVNHENEKNWYIKAECLKKFRKYEEAAAYNKKAIDYDPYNEFYWIQKAECLRDIGEEEEAIKSYDKAIELNPDNYKNRYFKARYLESIGRYEEAIEVYEELIRIDSYRIIGYKRKIGECLENLEKYEEAIAFYEKEYKADPFNGYLESKRKCLEKIGKKE